MRRILLLLILCVFPALVAAQDSAQVEADKSSLELWLQETLSGAGRKIEISGFSGALSARATVDRLQISDDDGLWFDAKEITLDWSRSALLSGRIEIDEFSAKEIAILRKPSVPAAAPDAQATQFQVPELPVSINIAAVKADQITLGESFFGAPIQAKLTGAIQLAEGAGTATLTAQRTDDGIGTFEVSGGYDNSTRVLSLDLTLQEGPNGIAAQLLDLPDQPTVDLRLTGTGPIDYYSAEMALATDGQDRLTGSIELSKLVSQDQLETPLGNGFAVDLRGDMTALFLPQYRNFFGTDVALRLRGQRSNEGRLDLQDLTVSTRSLQLAGTAALGADGWPERFDLSGTLQDPDGSEVLLPLSGPETRVGAARLKLAYDRQTGDRWTADFRIDSVTRPEAVIHDLQLAGGGRIEGATDTTKARFTAGMVYVANDIALTDAALARAIGPQISGQIILTRDADGPVVIDKLTLAGPGIELDANATLWGPDKRFAVDSILLFTAKDFARFSDLAGLSLGGEGTVSLVSTLLPFDGTIDAALSGSTNDLRTGIDQLDPVLTGASKIAMGFGRDTAGTRITGLTVETAATRLTGDATLTNLGGNASLDLALVDISIVQPELRGPATLSLSGSKTETEGITAIATLGLAEDRITLNATQPAGDMTKLPITLDLTAGLRDLSRYSAIAGRRLAGQVDTTLSGTTTPDSGKVDFTVQAQTRGLRTGSESLDKLVAGTATLSARVGRERFGALSVQNLRVTAPNLTLSGTLDASDGGGTATYQARIADIRTFTPDFAGPLSATGNATRASDGIWSVDSDITGPGGANARANGTISASGQLGLVARGQLPLGLLNGILEPRRLTGLADFDLTMRGPAALGSLGGTIRTSGAALSLPTLGQAINDITGQITLANGRASLALNGSTGQQGTLATDGSIGLTAPYPADIRIGLQNILLRDPQLYETTLGGHIALTGPLAGGAQIGGTIDLGRTEVQVPSTGVGALGDLPDVTHENADRAVSQTLARAGLTQDRNSAGSGQSSGPSYGLDITVRAGSRIFVRGRGLDAEMGGALTLGGTTANVVPRGQFDLIRGRLDILQQRFNLTEGQANMQGGFVPYVKLLATTTADTGTLITIGVEGPATEPEITFTSAPELPQDEVLAQLIFGRNLQSITPLQAIQLAAAIGTLAGRGGNGISDKFRQGIGLDDFDVVTDEDGNAAVRAGKYLSDNIYADVTIGSQGESEINLNLDINPTTTARGSFATSGETSIGIFVEKDY